MYLREHHAKEQPLILHDLGAYLLELKLQQEGGLYMVHQIVYFDHYDIALRTHRLAEHFELGFSRGMGRVSDQKPRLPKRLPRVCLH